MNQSKKLTDGALFAGIYVVVLLISSFIPFVALVAAFLLPLPFIYYSYRYNWKPSLLMFLVVIIVSTLFTSFLSLPLTVMNGLGGIMIGSAIHQKASAYETWARGTVGYVGGLLFAFLFTQLLFQVDFMEEFDQLVNQSINQSQFIMEQIGLANEAEEQLDILEEQVALLKNLIPMLLVLVSFILAFITQWIGYKVINRIENKQYTFPPFRHLNFPVAIVWIYFVGIILSLFQFDPNGLVFLGIQNVLMIAGIFMIIQGFSFIFFYAHAKNASKAIPIITIILTIFFLPILLPLIRILGIIDIGFGLRKRIANSK